MPDETTALAAASNAVEGAADQGGLSVSGDSQKPAGATKGAAAIGDSPKAESAPAATQSPWGSLTDPEEVEIAKRIASPADAIRSIKELRKANGSMVRIPGKDAKPDQVAAYRKAVGAPENAAEYFTVHDGEEPTPLKAATAEIFHEFNVPLAMAKKLEARVAELVEAQEAESERLAVKGREDSEHALRQEWGADFQKNNEAKVRAFKQFGDAEFQKIMDETHIAGVKLGDHPAVVRAWGRAGLKLLASDLLPTSPEQVQSVKQRHAELTREMHAARDRGDMMLANQLQAQRSALAEQLENEPLVGVAGRTS